LADFLTQSDRITDLAPGTHVRLQSIKPLSGIPDGPYTVVVFADRPGSVVETNKANNRLAIAGKRVLVIRPPTGANLTIENFQFQRSGPWPNLMLFGTVRNTGAGDSGPFWIEFWACPGDPNYPDLNRFACDSIHVDNLAAGQSLSLSDYSRTAYNSLRPGQFAIIGCVDRLDQVIETDETDSYAIVRGFLVPPH